MFLAFLNYIFDVLDEVVSNNSLCIKSTGSVDQKVGFSDWISTSCRLENFRIILSSFLYTVSYDAYYTPSLKITGKSYNITRKLSHKKTSSERLI